MVKWLLLALILGVALLLWRVSAYAKRKLPRVGHAAPDFELPDQHGKVRSLFGFRGKWVVLYFFLRADTPG